MKKALITGITGQDGSYLAEYLLSLDYEVYGLYRRISSVQEQSNLAKIEDHSNLYLIEGDITDAALIFRLVRDLQPEEMYSLAAMSHVGQSFKEPIQTFRTNAEATIIQLEAIKEHSLKTKYYFAGTSECLGGLACPENGYNEDSPFNPRSPGAFVLRKSASWT